MARTSSKSKNKPDKENLDVIELLVKGESLEEILFRLNIKYQLSELMKKYCERIGRKIKEVRFFYEGAEIRTKDTPKKLGMTDGGEIICVIEHKGGSKINFFKF